MAPRFLLALGASWIVLALPFDDGSAQPSHGQEPRGQPPHGQPPHEQPPRGQPPHEQQQHEQQQHEQQALAQQPYDEQPPPEQSPTDQQSADQQPADQQPAEQQPAEQQPPEQSPHAQQPHEQQPPAPAPIEIAGTGLTVQFPSVFTVQPLPPGDATGYAAMWTVTCGRSRCRMTLRLLPLEEYGFADPLDVFEYFVENERRDAPAFQCSERRVLAGPFGTLPHAIQGRVDVEEAGSTQKRAIRLFLCGTTDKSAYVFDLPLEPAPDSVTLDAVRAFLAKGIAWKGKPLDPQWTKEELQARWDQDVPDAKKNKLDKVLRTDHYVILTNSSGSKNFAEKMEECYARIKATYAFEELPGERLMPVFLFRNPDEYFAFFAQQFDATLEDARKSKGVADGDYYATWYEAPNDPVHIHEGTHQIFANRLRLRGGGSWFQEGVAEYMSTTPNDRNVAARTVKKGREMPLAKFVEIESLLYSPKKETKTGEDEASSQYELAAFLIEFVRESEFSKPKFVDWIHAVGATPRNDVPAVEAATKRTLGVDLAGLEKEWVEYAKKR